MLPRNARTPSDTEPRGIRVLGGAEVTIVGENLKGMMAILGVCAMLYAVESSMSALRPGEWIRGGEEHSMIRFPIQ